MDARRTAATAYYFAVRGLPDAGRQTTVNHLWQFVQAELAEAELGSCVSLLKEAILSQPRLHELAERPLLLTLMASLHAWRMGELPDDRQTLYEDTVDLLLYRWEKQRRVWDGQQETELQPSLVEWLKIDRVKMRQLLNKLAYEAHKEQNDHAQTADVPQHKLMEGLLALSPKNADIRPKQLEIYLRDRAGLLAERAETMFGIWRMNCVGKNKRWANR